MAFEELSEYEKGYIAGFIDGEGSINISKYNKGYFRLALCIYNTDKKTIDWIAKRLDCDGLLRTVDKRRDKLHTKNNYAIIIRRQTDLLKLLYSIKEYLITKKKQCEFGIEFLELILNRENKEYSKSEIAKMEKIYDGLKSLNRGD